MYKRLSRLFFFHTRKEGNEKKVTGNQKVVPINIKLIT